MLQVRDADRYRALAVDQRVREIELPPTRGPIYDRDLDELALSLPAKAVFADPTMLERRDEAAAALAPILGIREGPLRAALDADGSFVYLARGVDLDVAREVHALELPGIGLLEESKRYYPGGDLGAQVLGFVGIDGAGLEGLELQYESLLAGSPGSMVVEQDPSGNSIPQGESRMVEPVPGEGLVLTIDESLQFQTQRALEDAVRRNGAKGGTAIVMDPHTGEILAMATAPSFDANRFEEAHIDRTRNRAVTDVYEPGSVNKVITAAAAIEEGVIDLREILAVPDRYRVSDAWFHDSHPHGLLRMTLTDVIAQSSNIGTIMTAQRLGQDLFDDYLRRFGFGETTGLAFPGESPGILPPSEEWWGTSMGTIPIGQGVAVTPLQMTSVYATIANGGRWVEPTLVRGTLDRSGALVPAPAPDSRRIVSRRTARTVTGMLAHAVADGTGEAAQIPGYWVAGKTGTARKPFEDGLGYSDRYVASFIGFLPARDPQLVVAAILDEPVTMYGGIASAPLFSDIARFSVAHLRVAPAERPRVPPLAEEEGG